MKSDHNGKKSVVLFIPNTRWFQKRPWILVPNSALILTGLLKKQINFKIIDANIHNFSEDESVLEIKRQNPDVFLVSGVSVEYCEQYHKSFELAKSVNKSMVTVFGGVYPTLLPKESLEDPNVDYVFRGPAEGNRALRFLNYLLEGDKENADKEQGIAFMDSTGEMKINEMEAYFADLKKAPEPDYSLIDIRAYLNEQSADYNIGFEYPTGVLLTSYGCRYNCVFCAARTIRGKGVAFRKADDVIVEIKWLMENYDVTHFSFLDELFLGDRKRAEEILCFMAEQPVQLSWKMPNVSAWHLDDDLLELMKMAGCRAISVSVESGSERVLREIIRKPIKLKIFPGIVEKCRQLDIDIVANFVIGLPGETWQEIRQTFEVAEALNFDLCAFHIATPYPGTDLYRIANEQGLLPETFDFRSPDYFGTSRGFITTEEFSPFELMILRAFEWDRINFKTEEKTKKIARMMNIPLAELNAHRKQTRLKCGVHHPGLGDSF